MEAQTHTRSSRSLRVCSATRKQRCAGCASPSCSARRSPGRKTDLPQRESSFEEAVVSKEALREKAAMELGAAQRDAREAEQRQVAHERRLLADVDCERVAARQATADLGDA